MSRTACALAHERLPEGAEAMLTIAALTLMPRRLARQPVRPDATASRPEPALQLHDLSIPPRASRTARDARPNGRPRRPSRTTAGRLA